MAPDGHEQRKTQLRQLQALACSYTIISSSQYSSSVLLLSE